jgi:hypothetical protein
MMNLYWQNHTFMRCPIFFLLSAQIRLVFPDCSFLLLRFKRFLLCPASTSSILKHLFYDQYFLALFLTQLCCLLILLHSNEQQNAVVCALCWLHKIIQEAFNSTCSECPAYILLQGATRQNLRRNKKHHHKRQPCEHHQQSRVTRGDSKLPAFEVFFILWKPLKSTSL